MSFSEGPLFSESFVVAGGPVTAEQRDSGECYWQCPNINPTVSTTGKDAINVFSTCNRIFEAYRESGVDELPECAIVAEGVQNA